MKTRLVLRPGDGFRERSLNALARYLGDGEVLVVAVDTYKENDATLHVPHDPAAEVVAIEPPRIVPGGATEIVNYVVCRGSTRFRRVRVLADGVAEESDLELDAVRRGQAS